MSRIALIKSVVTEYGLTWAFNRALYGAKLRLMSAVPVSEKLFEKRISRPLRTDIFDVDVKELKSFLSDLPEDLRLKTVGDADKAIRGVIRGFSALDLDYGYPLDWQLNPLTGKRCGEDKKWYYIPDFDPERGDIKTIWEASRFSHFITFARAYLITGDIKYRAVFSKQLASWLGSNPYSMGANFKCGQECSLRMVNALLAYAVFRGSDADYAEDEENVRELVYRCYRKVLSNFFYAYRCIKNNHTISELMGMIVGAWCCGDSKRLKKAYRMLDGVIDSQFTSDGGYRQFSFNYQRLALQDLECILSVGKKTGISLAPESVEKIKKAALLMFQCQDGSFDMPNYGSNDGALVFPVSSCDYRDFRPVVNTAYALTAGKKLYEAGIHEEELIWFSGGRSLDSFGAAGETPRISSAFPEAGLFTLRSQKHWAMTILNDFVSRPAHMDQLHVDIWSRGSCVLCDAGTFSYADPAGKKLTGNGAHNTVSVEGVSQMSSRGPFMTYNWPKRDLSVFENGTFEGRMISKNGYVHTRRIESTDSGYTVLDTADRDYTVAFHTPCRVETGDGSAQLWLDGKMICEMTFDGEISVVPAKRSLYYLTLEDITCIRVRKKANETLKTTINFLED